MAVHPLLQRRPGRDVAAAVLERAVGVDRDENAGGSMVGAVVGTRPLSWPGAVLSEAALVRLAVALGAEACGGPLSAAERDVIAAALAEPSPDPALIAETRAAIEAGADPLGDLFCTLRPARRRREVGAFYTSPALVRLMVGWAMGAAPARLVDPGCGSGRFAVTAVRGRRDLEVVALDADPLATVITRAALAVVGAPRARVICGDYLTAALRPAPGRTAFVANPPYVRSASPSPASPGCTSSSTRRRRDWRGRAMSAASSPAPSGSTRATAAPCGVSCSNGWGWRCSPWSIRARRRSPTP
jgi:hypothetical protein